MERQQKNFKFDPVSGYSIYNPLIQENTKHNPLIKRGVLYPTLPKQQFDIIYADPPWHYNGKTQFDKSIIKDENPKYIKNIFLSSASFKYPTMKLAELINIKIDTILKKDCLLFMWTTNPHLDQAIQLGKAWGFKYKTVAFVWNKMVHNPGQYTLSYCELCLLFKKGRIPQPRGARNIKQLINVKRSLHSIKPCEVRNSIEKMFPTQSKIELFARHQTKGWQAWGLDIYNKV